MCSIFMVVMLLERVKFSQTQPLYDWLWGSGSVKMWSSMLDKILVLNGGGGQKWKDCVESSGHKMGVIFVYLDMIWVCNKK